MSYTPVYDNMYDSMIDVVQKATGWGGIEFFIFIAGAIFFVMFWNFARNM